MDKENVSPCVLVIDDDITVRLIAERNLQKHGFQVLLADSGKDGIELFKKKSVNIILLDYEMPGLSGLDTCQALRHQVINCEVPILMITGKDDEESIEAAFTAGATDFATKPLNWTLLIYRIRYILRASESFQELRLDKERLSMAQKIANIASWEWEPAKNKFFWSEEIYKLLSIEQSKRTHFNLEQFLEYIHPDDRLGIKELIYHCLNESSHYDCEHRIVDQNNKEHIVQHQGSAMLNEQGHVVNIVGTLRDITYSKLAERQIKYLAYYDPLTGLMNRQSFFSSINKLLSLTEKYQSISAILFLDLDDFKKVNDTLGHDNGDVLLKEISERLKACVRTSESADKTHKTTKRQLPNVVFDEVIQLNDNDNKNFSLARLGGDEFTIFLCDIPSIDTATKVCERIIRSLKHPFLVNQHQIYASFSIGVSIAPDDAKTVQELLKNADLAMYHAKKQGKNNFQFFNSSMNQYALKRLQLENDLRSALSKKQIFLCFQPKYNLTNQEIIGCEALMRWQHPKLGLVSPVDFIPLAEETGLIIELSNWLFETVLQKISDWKQQNLISPKFRVAMNVSGVQFNKENLVEKLVVLQHSYPGLFSHLELELTESILMKSGSLSIDILNNIKVMDITLSLDDFGTGYSSLSYLRSFPVDHLKIDRSFVSNLEKSQQDEAIVKAIISMAKSLGMTVIAEGIETQWQEDFLRNHNCDFGQGYLFSKPLNEDDFIKRL